jgi:NADH dehydrogenase FAD-containing subunit
MPMLQMAWNWEIDPFVYKHLGSVTSIGRYKALVDIFGRGS